MRGVLTIIPVGDAEAPGVISAHQYLRYLRNLLTDAPKPF